MKKQQSGGVNFKGTGSTHVGRDVVGRDKHENYYVQGFKQQKLGCIPRTFFIIIGFLIPGAVGGAFGFVIGAAIDSAASLKSGGAVPIAGAVILGLLVGIGFSSYVVSATKGE